MRPRPVNLPAAAAAAELVVVDFRERFELAGNFCFIGRFQHGVAEETARKWRQDLREIKSAQHFYALFQRILGARVIPVAHGRMHQKPPIPGEESAVLGDGELNQLSIFRVAIIKNVDAEQTKIANKLSQMSIGNKVSNIQDLQSIFREKSNWIVFDWEDIDFRFGANHATEIDRIAINKDQIDFRMRNTAGFDDVFDGCPFV